MLFGLVAGYFGGVADMIIMRFTDMVMSFPYILLVLVAAAVFRAITGARIAAPTITASTIRLTAAR